MLFSFCGRFLRRGRRLHQPDSPEIVRQVWLKQVLIGKREIALHSPIRAPGITDNERLFRVVISNGANGMASDNLLTRLRHGGLTRVRYRRALKAVIHRETKNKRKAG